MADDPVSFAFLAAHWHDICQSARRWIPASLSPQKAALALDITTKLCSQPIPTTNDELSVRFTQAIAHDSIIGAITYATDRQLPLLATICQQPLPRTKEEFSSLMTQLVALAGL